MIPVLEPPIVRWYCPNCGLRKRTKEPGLGVLLHTCPKLHDLTAPMLTEGTAAKVEARLREDYVGDELVQIHDGRPYMSVVTTRDDGQDVVVFPPTARLSLRDPT